MEVVQNLKLPQLRQSVMPEGLVQGRVPVLVGHVQVAVLSDQKSNDLSVLSFHGLRKKIMGLRSGSIYRSDENLGPGAKALSPTAV